MNAYKLFNSLCTPAQLYLGLSTIAVISSCYQNIGNPNSFACGLMKAQSPVNNVVYIIMEVAYVLIWTYLLNLLCKKGYSKVSWMFVLLPFIAMFVLIGLLILSLNNM